MSDKTVGLLSPGAMGSVVGRVLIEHGVTVLTCLEDRGPATLKDVLQVALNAGQLRAWADAVVPRRGGAGVLLLLLLGPWLLLLPAVAPAAGTAGAGATLRGAP